MAAKKNHYEVLEISRDAELIDVKKAYRRLALKHHPDRNGGSAEATEKFKDISQAYTILSDATSRRNYDVTLKFSVSSMAASAAAASSTPSSSPSKNNGVPERQPNSESASSQGVRDPFQQFDDLFRNDPFFHDSFQDMNDAFAQRFDDSQCQNRDDVNTSNDDANGFVGMGQLFTCVPGGMKNKSQNTNVKKVPWSQWVMNKLGIELSVTSYSHQADGTVEASTYSSKPSGTYTNKKSRTYVENGKQVSVMSMEKNGNRIEDKFIAGKLVERKVNGEIEETMKQVTN